MLAAERQRQQDTQVLLDSIAQRPGALLLTTEPTTAEAEVLAQLQTVTARQNERDAALDAQDLRRVLRGALQANSDAEMIRTLQVGRDEMPEAIKTLQRALEKEVERESVEGEPVLADVHAYTDAAAAAVPVSLARSATTASAGSHTTSSSAATGHSRGPRDTLDREFIETGARGESGSWRAEGGVACVVDRSKYISLRIGNEHRRNQCARLGRGEQKDTYQLLMPIPTELHTRSSLAWCGRELT